MTNDEVGKLVNRSIEMAMMTIIIMMTVVVVVFMVKI